MKATEKDQTDVKRCSTCDWWESEDSILLNGAEQARCLAVPFDPDIGEIERRTMAEGRCESWVNIEDF